MTTVCEQPASLLHFQNAQVSRRCRPDRTRQKVPALTTQTRNDDGGRWEAEMLYKWASGLVHNSSLRNEQKSTVQIYSINRSPLYRAPSAKPRPPSRGGWGWGAGGWERTREQRRWRAKECKRVRKSKASTRSSLLDCTLRRERDERGWVSSAEEGKGVWGEKKERRKQRKRQKSERMMDSLVAEEVQPQHALFGLNKTRKAKPFNVMKTKLADV